MASVGVGLLALLSLLLLSHFSCASPLPELTDNSQAAPNKDLSELPEIYVNPDVYNLPDVVENLDNSDILRNIQVERRGDGRQFVRFG